MLAIYIYISSCKSEFFSRKTLRDHNFSFFFGFFGRGGYPAGGDRAGPGPEKLKPTRGGYGGGFYRGGNGTGAGFAKPASLPSLKSYSCS